MASVVINTRINNRKAEADLKELQAKAKETAREINAVEKGLGSATTKRNKLRDDLEAARQIGADGIVLLKNNATATGSKVLPVDIASAKKILHLSLIFICSETAPRLCRLKQSP